MEASTPKSEPAYITALRKEAYINGLNAGSLLFIAPAVSQAAACDGTRITTTAVGQDVAPGTLPIYQSKLKLSLELLRCSCILLPYYFRK